MGRRLPIWRSGDLLEALRVPSDGSRRLQPRTPVAQASAPQSRPLRLPSQQRVVVPVPEQSRWLTPRRQAPRGSAGARRPILFPLRSRNGTLPSANGTPMRRPRSRGSQRDREVPAGAGPLAFDPWSTGQRRGSRAGRGEPHDPRPSSRSAPLLGDDERRRAAVSSASSAPAPLPGIWGRGPIRACSPVESAFPTIDAP